MDNEIPNRKMYLEGGAIGFNPAYVEWLEEQLKEAYDMIKKSDELRRKEYFNEFLNALDDMFPDYSSQKATTEL